MQCSLLFHNAINYSCGFAVSHGQNILWESLRRRFHRFLFVLNSVCYSRQMMSLVKKILYAKHVLWHQSAITWLISIYEYVVSRVKRCRCKRTPKIFDRVGKINHFIHWMSNLDCKLFDFCNGRLNRQHEGCVHLRIHWMRMITTMHTKVILKATIKHNATINKLEYKQITN